MEEDSFNQTFFSFETTLSTDTYQMMERQFQKEKTKTFTILKKDEIIGKLHPLILEEEEYVEAFTLFENNILAIPDKMNTQLIKVLIHYFYFKELKPLSIKLIFDFLDLSLFFHVTDLISKILMFIKTNITTAETSVFIRRNIFPFIFEETSIGENQIKRLFEDSDIFLLKNNYLEEYLAFYDNDYFSHPNFDHFLDVEEELLKRIELMNSFNIDGLQIVKLLILFKDHLTKIKAKKDADFDFKKYAEMAIEKFVKLKELNPKQLSELLSKLELNTKSFKIKLLNEKITFLEGEMISLKQNSLLQINEIKEASRRQFEDLKTEYDQKLKEQIITVLSEIKREIGNKNELDQNIQANVITNVKEEIQKMIFPIITKVDEIQKNLDKKNEVDQEFPAKLIPLIRSETSEITKSSNKTIEEMLIRTSKEIKNEFDIRMVNFQNLEKKNSEIMEKMEKLMLADQKLKELELKETPSAKSVTYTLFMSSKYDGPPNTYEALQNDVISQGAGTQPLPNSYIEAQFPYKVKVCKVTVAGPSGMQGGWSSGYTNGQYLQYSNDRISWVDATKILGVPEGLKTFDIEPVAAQYWRLFNKDNIQGGYCATGVFRFE